MMIQARSLAEVVDLAENPPFHYQQRALLKPSEPLVLYIARVPGSRDVFLTTIKPLDKVVRAEDVRSSLYYVHADSGQDEDIRQGEASKLKRNEDDLVHDRAEEQSGIPAVRRKPLPQQPQWGFGDRPEPPPNGFPHYEPPSTIQGDNTKSGRKPVNDDHGATHESINGTSGTLSPKLLTSQFMLNSSYLVDNAALRNKPQRQNITLCRWSQQPPLDTTQARQRLYHGKVQELGGAYMADSILPNRPFLTSFDNDLPATGASLAASIRGESYITDPESSLTLIRRYDGKQSNVGQIMHNATDAERSFIATIDILSPGYEKVARRGAQGGHRRQAGDCYERRLERPVFNCILRGKKKSRKPRQGVRPGSYQSHLHNREANGSIDSRRHSQNRSEDFPSYDSTSVTDEGSEVSAFGRHTFPTPWGGTCEFDPSIAGRSLRCKHTPSGDGVARPAASTMSELRFNLPSSPAFRSPQERPQKNPQAAGFKKSRNTIFFSKGPQRHSSHSNTIGPANPVLGPREHDHDRLDLSLGQEHAGGGFGGKQAKL
ncbi:MAG: hypothetical protein Q9163_004566, partial [Psora crenata]